MEDRAGSRWKWAVLVAVYAQSVIIAYSTLSAGIMYVALLDRYGGNETKISFVATLSHALLALLAPISSLVVNRFSCRVAMTIGGVLLTLSGILSAFVSDLDMLLFTHGIIGGIGYSLTFPVGPIVIGFYFDKHRNAAISLYAAMVGFGMFAASPLTLALLDNFSLTGTFIMLAAIHAHLCIVGVVCKPSPKEIEVNKMRFRNAVASDKRSDHVSCMNRVGDAITAFRQGCDLSVLKMAPFILFQLSNFTWAFMMLVCTAHFPNYATIQGVTEEQIILLMSCFSISNTCGRFLAAFTLTRDRLKENSLHIQMCMIGLMGIVSVLFPLYSHFKVSKYLFAVVTGLCTGGPNALNVPVAIGLVGVDRMSNAHGFGMFFLGSGTLLGPPFAGFIYGQTGSYKYSFIFGGCVCMVGAGCSLTAQILQRRRKHLEGQECHTKRLVDEAEVKMIIDPIKQEGVSSFNPQPAK